MSSFRCDDEVFRDGRSVLLVASPRSHTVDEWLAEVVGRSGVRVDWHMYAGRSHVMYLGGALERARVMEAIAELLPRLIDMYMACPDNFTSSPRREDVMASWLSDDGSLLGPVLPHIPTRHDH